MENIGGGSFVSTAWTGSEGDPTMSLTGHPVWLPGIDFAMGDDRLTVPTTTKQGIVKFFDYKKNPIAIELIDGSKLFFSLDQYKRIQGDLPIIPKHTQITVVFQRLPFDKSNNASKIISCTSKFNGPEFLRKHYKVGYTYSP